MKRAWVLLFVASLATTALGQTCQGRLIQHAMGETCVPKVAQRVVVLDTGELDSALALGVKPVGAVTAPGQPFQGYLLSLTEGIQSVGTIQQPNLEKILALKPAHAAPRINGAIGDGLAPRSAQFGWDPHRRRKRCSRHPYRRCVLER